MPIFLFNAEYNVAFSFFTLEKISHPSCFLFLTKHNVHTKFDLAMTNWTQLKTLYFLNSALHDLSSPNNIWNDFFTRVLYVGGVFQLVLLSLLILRSATIRWGMSCRENLLSTLGSDYCHSNYSWIQSQFFSNTAPHSAVLVRVQLCGYSQDLERVHHFSTQIRKLTSSKNLLEIIQAKEKTDTYFKFKLVCG